VWVDIEGDWVKEGAARWEKEEEEEEEER